MLIEIIKPEFEFEDERGYLKQLTTDGYKQINVIHSKAGAFRGGHYHRHNQEAFYVIDGEFTLDLTQGGLKESYEMKKGSMFIIPKEVIHSFNFTTDSYLVSMYDKGVEEEDGEKDIVAV